jgi:hypothetical protein
VIKSEGRNRGPCEFLNQSEYTLSNMLPHYVSRTFKDVKANVVVRPELVVVVVSIKNKSQLQCGLNPHL